MTILAHDLHSPVRTPENPARARAETEKTHLPATHLPAIRRFLLSALTILLAGGGLAAAIALKTAVYLSRQQLGAG